MADKRYLIRLNQPGPAIHVLIAASVGIHGDHLVFLNSKGELIFLIMLEAVESWMEADL
jgi:hypothetical protein